MTTYCGYIAICGRPNVGKSTLLNAVLLEKISITSRKPQTTRHRILGIHTEGAYQFIYVDTPGIHQSKRTMNRVMNQTALDALRTVDVILFVLEAGVFTKEDEAILQNIVTLNIPCILVLNKIDKIKDKDQLLPWVSAISTRYDFKSVLPLSAKTGFQVEKLAQCIQTYLPENDHFYEPDAVTDRSVRFLCSELIREKIFRLCGEEVPYGTSVLIESFEETEALCRIHALIFVEKTGQKRIIIGEKGKKLKEISTSARLEIEQLVQKKVFLRCFCKLKETWSTDALLLRALGHD